MKVRVFLKAVAKYCKVHCFDYEYDPRRGKGSHGVIRIEARFAVVLDIKAEMSKGLVHRICRTLEIPPSAIWDRAKKGHECPEEEDAGAPNEGRGAPEAPANGAGVNNGRSSPADLESG